MKADDLGEVYEAKNLAAVTGDLLAHTEGPLTIDLILRWHSMLLSGIRDDVEGRFRKGDEWVRVGAHLGDDRMHASGASATNKAKRQTTPAFRMRDRWMIAEEYR